jgi:hypothetical protein
VSLVSEGGGEPSLAEIAQRYIDSLWEDANTRTSGSECVAGYPEDREKPPPRVGDLWLTRGTSEDPPTLIAITWIGDSVCRAVVVLDEPELAATDDLLLSAEQSALGVPLALCAWRDLPVAEADLLRLVGSLPDEVVEPLAMLLQHSLTGGFHRRALGSSRLSTGEGGVRWLIEFSGDDHRTAEYLSGAPILSETDPRIRVREELVRFTTYLEDGALQANVGDEIAVRDAVQQIRPALPTFRRESLLLAASEAEENPNETAGRVPFAALEIEGMAVEALANAEGMVFLRGGKLPSGAKKLFLGQDGFVLKRLSESSLEVEVEDLGSVDLEQFLDRHRGDPESFPIRFGE